MHEGDNLSFKYKLHYLGTVIITCIIDSRWWYSRISTCCTSLWRPSICFIIGGWRNRVGQSCDRCPFPDSGPTIFETRLAILYSSTNKFIVILEQAGISISRLNYKYMLLFWIWSLCPSPIEFLFELVRKGMDVNEYEIVYPTSHLSIA